MTLQLSHFSAALVFSLCASIVFGITSRNTSKEMVRYGAYCFALFIGGLVVGAWLMWLIRH